jgi:hypothetical protein
MAPAAGWRLRRVATAIAAALVCAAFFDAPIPSPTISSAILTCEVNRRSCGGPSVRSKYIGDTEYRACANSWSAVLGSCSAASA